MERKANSAIVPMCGRCGYELRGLRVEEKCPECGTDVWASSPLLTDPGVIRARKAATFGRLGACCVLAPVGVFVLVIGWFIFLPALLVSALIAAITAICLARRGDSSAGIAALEARRRSTEARSLGWFTVAVILLCVFAFLALLLGS